MSSNYSPVPISYQPEDRFFYVFKFPERIIITAHKGEENGYIEIHRPENVVERTIPHWSREEWSSLQQQMKDMEADMIYGVIGVIRLISGPHLLVITKATKVSHLGLYRMDQAKAIPFSNSELHMNEQQIQLNNRYRAMLNSFLETKNFYFSFYYDLTNTLQRQQQINGRLPQLSMQHIFNITNPPEEYYSNVKNLKNFHETVDSRFFWNYNCLQYLANRDIENLHHYCPILMMGSVSQKSVRIEGKEMELLLISRRSVKNAGTRFNCRGSDLDGNASNFVETEQILIYGDNVASLVQVRGSIPLIWKQQPNLRYKPTPEIDVLLDHVIPVHKHIDELKQKYGLISIVNLVDHKGFEGRLEQEFSDKIRYISTNYYPILYHSFDFHKECSKMRWHRLNILMEQILQDILNYGYFAAYSDEIVISTQKGIIRTNCIDSLDRTNVVQSMIAKLVLENQLRSLKILPMDRKLENYSFYKEFQDAWGNNADILSIQYAGTPALKTDFTRTGKRTKIGMIKDGINSLTRYYRNNFADGYRQDCYDLFLGKHYVDPREGFAKDCPLQKPMRMKQIVLPSMLLVAVSMLFYSLLATSETNIFYVVLFVGFVGVSFGLIMQNGSELVDMPKLINRGNDDNSNTDLNLKSIHQS